jgi:hypothetical protein
MIIEQMVQKILQDGGMLGGWTNPNGEPVAAPVVQIGLLRETDIGENRCVLIRSNNGGGTKYVQRPSVDVYLFGIKDLVDAYNITSRAGDIFGYILTSPCYGDIMGTTQVSMSPTLSSSEGRPYILINFTAISDRGIT